MAFSIPSLSDTRAFLVAVGHSLFPDRNYGNPRTYHGRRAGFLAAAVTQLHFQTRSEFDELMPDTAGDDGPIDRWGFIKSVARKEATPARKSAAARVLGTPGTSVPFGRELIHPSSGLRFAIATATTVAGSGLIDADIVAIDTGAQTRLSAGEVLRFSSTPAGLQTNVTLQKNLDQDGFDREGFGAYRGRVLDAFGKPQSGGNSSDYRAWGLEVIGIMAAYSYPNRAGIGTIDIVGLKAGSGTSRVMSGGELVDYVAHVKTKAPEPLSSQTGPLRGLTVVADPQSVEIAITPNGEASFAFDWSGGPLTVSTWTSGTRTLQFTAARPPSIKAGHRIVLSPVASAQDGIEYKIEALSSTDSVVLEVVPPVAPVHLDLAYSGGPLTTPIRNAIVAHINGETVYAGKRGLPSPASSLDSVVGLEVLAEGVGPANPGGIYGTWSGGLLRSVLGKIAIYKAGVRNYAIVTPAADYEAIDYAFPLDAQIGLVTPRSVLIRSV